MDLKTFENQITEAGVVTDDIPVIFRTPNCSAYYNINCHIVNINNKEHLMIDLVDNSNKGSDFDLDKNDNSRPPVEDSIKLNGFTVRFAKDNVLTHNLTNYPLIKNMINIIIKASNIF